ncbi:MAG TPA: sigma-54-dependent Fis family transcriptional regulator [Desulfobulbus sp.]|nr:sigma-54-dependent Fis family transcriptional regulator [Desulfobulbus sp.]
MKARIRMAVIDDEETARNMMSRLLDSEGFEVESFAAGVPFLERMEEAPFDIVFSDLMLPDISGLDILQQIKQVHEEAEVIIVTGHASIDSAIEATQKGAFHYLTKPCKRHDIALLARRAKEKIEIKEENRRLRRAMDTAGPIPGIVGASKAMQEIFSLIKKVATVNCNVLLEADTGTGKQVVARAIHELSPRKDHPFVYFNCGGFTEELIASELFGHEKGAFTGATSTKQGLFETAAGGTVLLDEIGEMPFSMQVKLLHVLQEREVLRVGGTRPVELDIRIIAATNRNLKEAIAGGRFREDLYYRLNVVGIQLPRLKERPEDIPLLASYFIKKFNVAFGKKVKSIAPQAMDVLMAYDFPGNVRELENIIQRSVALAEDDVLKIRDLPDDFQRSAELLLGTASLPSLEEVEKEHIEKVLRRTGYNRKLASTILKIPRTTLWRRMKKYNIVLPEEQTS